MSKRISTASAKQKGRKLQQYVRDKIIDLLKPYGVVPEDVKSTSMGASGEDVQLSPFARHLLPVSVECKSHKSMAVYKHYEQAITNGSTHEPLLVIKANHKKPLAVIDFDYYIFLEHKRIERETND